MFAIIAAVQRALRIVSTALITAGVVVLADVATTLAWREPVSSIYGSIKQGKAEDELAELERAFPGRAERRRVAPVRQVRGKAAILSRLLRRQVEEGDAVGRIEIPAIDVEAVAVEGTDTASLQKGPGHYPQTPLPGAGGTSAFAGHRTTYLAPFRHVDELARGDEIVVEMPYADLVYEVVDTRVVDDSAVGIIHQAPRERLILTACHPLYSAAQRIAAFARLTRVTLTAPGNRD